MNVAPTTRNASQTLKAQYPHHRHFVKGAEIFAILTEFFERHFIRLEAEKLAIEFMRSFAGIVLAVPHEFQEKEQ